MYMWAIYRKSSNKPPGRLIYFKHRRWGRGGAGLLNRDGGLCESGLICFSRNDGFHSPKRTKVDSGKAQVQEVGGRAAEDWSKANHAELVVVNKPSRISPHEVLQSWLISNAVYHLLLKNNKGKGKGLKREGGLVFIFFPWKRVAHWREGAERGAK